MEQRQERLEIEFTKLDSIADDWLNQEKPYLYNISILIVSSSYINYKELTKGCKLFGRSDPPG